MVVSECANHPETIRGQIDREREQVETIEQDLALLEKHPFVAGFALWCFNDYPTLRKRRYRRFSGVYDAWRLPKSAVYLLRARYGTEPVLFLDGAWGEGYPANAGGGEIELITNCDEVCVRAGSREIWSGSVEQSCLRFRTDATGQPLRARARKGDQECTFVLPWHGPAVRLALSAEPGFEQDPRHPAGRLRLFRLEALDARGIPARSWSSLVPVRTEGPLRLCPWRADGRWMLSGGVARIFAERTPGAGPYRLSASHPTLGTAEWNSGR